MIGDVLSELADASALPTDSVESLLAICNLLGMDEAKLRTDLKALLQQRIVLWLVGEINSGYNFTERKRQIARRFRKFPDANLGEILADSDGLLSIIAKMQSAAASARASVRTGIASVEEGYLRDLYAVQNFRCAVCGVPLHMNYRKSCDRFSDGLEPYLSPELDHVIPFYLLGNAVDYELLCSQCNSIKNDRLGVHEDGFVLSANHIRSRDQRAIARRMAFWSLYVTRHCEMEGCETNTALGVLFVQPKHNRLFSYGNLECKCAEHASESAWWLHEPHEVTASTMAENVTEE